MFKVLSNSKAVAFQIDKDLDLLRSGVIKAVDRTLESIYVDARSNASESRSPEKDGLEDAIEIERGNKIVGVNNVKAPYAPFIEFGTKAKFSLQTPDLAGIASKYRGIPMDFSELVERIERSTGLSKEQATGIAKKYGKQGTTARPFFYPAVFKSMVVLRRGLERAVRIKI